MKIIITIGHPAHVHYFKNAARILQEKGHQILFFIRDRECIVELVKDLGFDYICYGKGGDGMVSKMVQIPIIDYKLLRVALRFKPDMFLSFSSPYAAHVSKMLGRPHIALDDTEYAKLQHFIYRPCTDVILSPYVWYGKLHKRQILINAFQELFYLGDNYFKPQKSVLNDLGIDINERYCIVRFVALTANHDVGVDKMSYGDKLRIIQELAKHYKVFITSEHALPKDVEKYRLSLHPSQFHSVVSFASLCVSEGITTASEAAVLGVPTILLNPLRVGYCDEEEKFGLLHKATKVNDVIDKIKELSIIDNIREVYKEKNKLMQSFMIDPTAFLVWFVENYPKSKQIMRENQDYQKRFE